MSEYNVNNSKHERIEKQYQSNHSYLSSRLDKARADQNQAKIDEYAYFLALLEKEHHNELRSIGVSVQEPSKQVVRVSKNEKVSKTFTNEDDVSTHDDRYIVVVKKEKLTKAYEKKLAKLHSEEDYYLSVYNDHKVHEIRREIDELTRRYHAELLLVDEWAIQNPGVVLKRNSRRATRHEQERRYVFDGKPSDIDDYLLNQYKKKRKRDRGEFIKSLGQVKNEEDILVKMRDVRIGFKIGNVERVVIDHLNLDIKRGEILGLVGESGSGKTTVGRAVIRVNHVSDGVIAYNNVPISGKIPFIRERALKTKVQMVFQDPAASLNERANVDYIISEGLRAFHMYKDNNDRLRKIYKVLEEVGLRPEHLTRYPHEFSGGQRQRIGIARCMVMEPEFVIADEPISALDVSIRAQVLNLLKEFQKERNMTILFIAHDLSVVRYISDRIAVIYGGEIVELCDANRLFKMPLHAYTKALLSAVPVPDPRIERVKKITTYHPSIHGYQRGEKIELREIEEGHFVRCSDREYNDCLEAVKNERKGEK